MPLFTSLYNFAYWLTRDRTEAEDLVQETFAKALRGFASFRPETSFKAWIFRILQNTFLTSRAGLRAHPTVSLASDDDEGGVDAVATGTPESTLLGRASREPCRAAWAVPVRGRSSPTFLVTERRGPPFHS